MTADTETKTIVERLFNAGAHFGFSKSRRHPTSKPYIFGNKQGVDIFDLEKVASSLETAKEVLAKAGKEGKIVLFVGTKDEISPIVKNEALRAEAPYVTNRWIGGMLTNFSEIKKRIERLKALTVEGEAGELERKYTKKERVVIGREIDKLTFNFGSIKDMDLVPHLLVVVDPRHDEIAVTEARELKIPVVGIMSSDNDANKVTTPVFVNDSLQASVSLVLGELVDAYIAGKKEFTPAPAATRSNATRLNERTTRVRA